MIARSNGIFRVGGDQAKPKNNGPPAPQTSSYPFGCMLNSEAPTLIHLPARVATKFLWSWERVVSRR